MGRSTSANDVGERDYIFVSDEEAAADAALAEAAAADAAFASGRRVVVDVAESAPPVVIPHTELQPETLQRVIEAFVLREGTEYGAGDVALAAKVAQVQTQLAAGTARVVYHPDSEAIDIVATRDTVNRRR